VTGGGALSSPIRKCYETECPASLSYGLQVPGWSGRISQEHDMDINELLSNGKILDQLARSAALRRMTLARGSKLFCLLWFAA
jgi:hypothetical protein